jgi:iron complex transport system substrate-binding protein
LVNGSHSYPLRRAVLTLVLLMAGAGRALAGQRIVSLAPSVTEMLFAVGAGPGVVGVSQYCDYPPAVASLPRVGSFLTPNVEAIIGLRPTLIVGLATSANERELKGLEGMGYPVLLADDDSIEAIESSIEAIGARTGHSGTAHEVVSGIQQRLNRIRARLRGVPPVKVLMVVGHDPLVAVGDGFLGQLLALADTENVAAGLNEEWPRLAIEYIIAQAPEVILDGEMGSESSESPSFWSRYSTIPAVRNHRVLGYPQSPILHPGPRLGASLEILAALIHPEVFGVPAKAIKSGLAAAAGGTANQADSSAPP